MTAGIKCQLLCAQKEALGGLAKELLKVSGRHLTVKYESRLELDLYYWCSLFKKTRGDKSNQKPTFLLLILILFHYFFIVSLSQIDVPGKALQTIWVLKPFVLRLVTIFSKYLQNITEQSYVSLLSYLYSVNHYMHCDENRTIYLYLILSLLSPYLTRNVISEPVKAIIPPVQLV